MRPVAIVVVLVAAACGNSVEPAADLAVDDERDLAIADLGPSGCPPQLLRNSGPCRGNAVCRYPTDAGPYDHMRCSGAYWQFGDCPFGPGYALGFKNCTRACSESFGEAYTSCVCLPNGDGVCCTDTGGPPTCGNYDGGS